MAGSSAPESETEVTSKDDARAAPYSKDKKNRSKPHASKACQGCKRARTRCIPVDPNPTSKNSPCQRCEDKKELCEFDPAPDKRSNRVITKAYVEKLKARIEELEQQVASPSRSMSETVVEGSPAGSGSVEPSTTRPEFVPSGTLMMENDGELRWHGETTVWGTYPIQPIIEQNLPANLNFLPTPLATPLHSLIIDLAFKWHINSLRVVEQHSFIADLKTGQRTQEYSPFLHLAILAVGCRYVHDAPPELCSDPTNPATRGEPFMQAAFDLIGSELISPRLSTITGLLTLAIFLAGVNRAHSGWVVAGMASRICQDFGLHIDPPADSSIPESTRLRRREAFWACAADDTCWSMCIGRPCTINLLETNQPDLLLLDPESSLLLGAVWPYSTRLQRIGWHINRFNFSRREGSSAQETRTGSELWRDLRAWHENLPAPWREPEAAAESAQLFEVFCNYCLLVIVLLKPFYQSMENADLHALALEQCPLAARNASWLVRRYRSGPGLHFAPNNVYHCIFHGAAMSLLIASSTHDMDRLTELLDDASVCIDGLIEHAVTWPSARFSVAALIDLRANVLTSHALPVDPPATAHVTLPRELPPPIPKVVETLQPEPAPMLDLALPQPPLVSPSVGVWDSADDFAGQDYLWGNYFSSGWTRPDAHVDEFDALKEFVF